MEPSSNGTSDGASDDPKMEILRLTRKIQELHEEGDVSTDELADHLGALIVKLIEMEECEEHGAPSTEDLTLQVSVGPEGWEASVDGLCCGSMNAQAEERAEETLERLLPQS